MWLLQLCESCACKDFDFPEAVVLGDAQQGSTNTTSLSTSTIVGSQAIIDELNSGRADLSLYPTPVTSST
jgi:hypothetical protein